MTMPKKKRNQKPKRLPAKAIKSVLYAAFDELPDWTTNEIAEAFPVHFTTVFKWRKQWREEQSETQEEINITPKDVALRLVDETMPPNKHDQFSWGFVVGGFAAAAFLTVIIFLGSN
jgi:transposase-like protein